MSGDRIYDYAKVYQSVTGYDAVYHGKIVCDSYFDKIRKHFEDRFLEKYGENYMDFLKTITASLYFSLIPLHDNDKCQKYFSISSELLGVG